MSSATAVSMESAQANKEKLLQHLKEQGIDFDLYEHPAVLTVEEQAKHVGHVEGGISKNLLLKDKKGRLVLISALTSTKVDLKNMSIRLGLGKSGLRMAPDDALSSILQVPPGCVTPMALFNEPAREVGLLLDRGFKAHAKSLFHPLSNDATIAVSSAGLDAFLRSVGKGDSYYVDLEADPVVGPDQRPDLAPFLPSPSEAAAAPGVGTTAPATPAQSASASGRETPGGAAEGGTAGTKGVAEKGGSRAGGGKGKPKEGPAVGTAGDNVPATSGQAVGLMLAALEAEVGEATRERLRQKLTPQLEHLLVMFKNAAYTQGFSAAKASLKLQK